MTIDLYFNLKNGDQFIFLPNGTGVTDAGIVSLAPPKGCEISHLGTYFDLGLSDLVKIAISSEESGASWEDLVRFYTPC